MLGKKENIEGKTVFLLSVNLYVCLKRKLFVWKKVAVSIWPWSASVVSTQN